MYYIEWCVRFDLKKSAYMEPACLLSLIVCNVDILNLSMITIIARGYLLCFAFTVQMKF